MNCFDRSGLARLSDLDAAEWKAAFEELDARQKRFLERESEFRSPEYRWPRNALHNWSRVWEYPYVLHHLSRVAHAPAKARVADIGSGVTFFPFVVADLGCDVVCTDIDAICAKDLGRAISVVPPQHGTVSFRQTDGSRLPFADGELDAAYCISVLEHVPEPAVLADEMARILKPNGVLILTIDLDLRGDLEIGVEAHGKLMSALLGRFSYDPAAPDTTIHPADALTSFVGPCPELGPTGLGWLRFLARHSLRGTLGKALRDPRAFVLAAQGMTLIRK